MMKQYFKRLVVLLTSSVIVMNMGIINSASKAENTEVLEASAAAVESTAATVTSTTAPTLQNTTTTTTAKAWTETTTAVWMSTTVTTTTTITATTGESSGYPITGEKVVSVGIIDNDTGYNIYGDVNVTVKLLTTDDINSSDENAGKEIAVWNIAEEGTQPNVVNVPYAIADEDELLFISVELDGFPENYTSDFMKTLFIFAPLSDDTCNFEVGLTRIYNTTLAPQDYCDSCGAVIPEGEGVRTPLGLYICNECCNAGAGGTTTAPVSTTTTNHVSGTGTTTANTTTTTTTTISTTQTTVVDYCYATQLDYDDSPMKVGETRAIRFYHPATQTSSSAEFEEVSGNISYEYVEGSDTVYITALEAGTAKMYIVAHGCAFGEYVHIEIENEEAGTTTAASSVTVCGDANSNGDVEVADAVFILQGIANPSDEKFSLTEDGKVKANCYEPEKTGVDSEDALAIMRYMAEICSVLPVAEN